MSNAYESLINEWLADPIVSKYYSSIPDLDYNTIDQNKFFNEPTSYLNWIGPTTNYSFGPVNSKINDYSSAYNDGIQNSGLILPYINNNDITSVLRIPMLSSTKDSAPSLGKSYGWSTEILGNEASGFKTQETPDSYINYLNDLVNYFPDTEFDVSGLLTNAGIGGLSIPTSWRGDVNIPLIDIPNNLDGYVRTKDYSYDTANPYRFEGAQPINTPGERVADQVLMKGAALSELLPKFQDISNQLATGYDKNIELNDTPEERAFMGGVGGLLGTLLTFTPLAPLGYAMQMGTAINDRNLLQGIGAAVGASGALQGLGTVGDSFAAADAAQLAEQGLSNAAIAQSLGQAYNMGSVASNTLAGLTSVGITDPLYQSIATGGLTGGINAGLSGEDLGQGVLAGITGSAVGNAINSAPIGTSGNSTIDAGVSGLKGGLSNALTNTILGNDVNIGDTILAGAQKGLTKNLYGQALSAAKPAIKDFFSSWGSDDQMPSDEQLQELQFTNPDAYDWYMFGDEMGNLDQTDYSWMTNPNDTFNDPEFNDNTVSQFLNGTNTVGTENVTTTPYVNLADSITSTQLPDALNTDSNPTPWTDLPPSNVPLEPVDWGNIQDPSNLPWFDQSNTGNASVDDLINNVLFNANPDVGPISVGNGEQTGYTGTEQGDTNVNDFEWNQLADIFDMTNGGDPYSSSYDFGLGDGVGIGDLDWQQALDIFDLTGGDDPYNPDGFNFGDIITEGDSRGTGGNDLQSQQDADIFDLTEGGDPYNNGGFGSGSESSTSDSLTSSGVLKMIKDEVNKLMGGGAAGASNSALLYTLLQALMKSKQVGAGNQLSQDAVNMVVNSGEKGTPNRLNTDFGLPKTSVGVLPQMAAPTTNGIFDLGLTRK